MGIILGLVATIFFYSSGHFGWMYPSIVASVGSLCADLVRSYAASPQYEGRIIGLNTKLADAVDLICSVAALLLLLLATVLLLL